MQLDLSSESINLLLELLTVEHNRLSELRRTFDSENEWQRLIKARKLMVEKTLDEVLKQVDS